MGDDLMKRLRMTGDNHAADAIERLSAENAALKSDLRVAGVSDSFYKLTVAQRDAERITNDRLSARIAELESGQPVPHRGEMWQLVPVELPPEIVNAIHKRPSWPSTVHSFWRITIDALTASAQEAQEDKT